MAYRGGVSRSHFEVVRVRQIRGSINMRGGLSLFAVFVPALGPWPVFAGPRSLPDLTVNEPSSSHAGFETYRGYTYDLSENSNRADVASTADMIHHQLDVVESSGLSPRVLQFFRSVPIVASEMACLDENAAAACYGFSLPDRGQSELRTPTIWDNDTHRWTNSDPVQLAADSGVGVILLRPNMIRYEKDPVMLHELLHAYHAKLMPNGYENKGIKEFYAEAQSKNLFPKEA